MKKNPYQAQVNEMRGRVSSYGLLEDVGQSRTAVDQSDGDDAYFELCSELYGGIWAKVYCPRSGTSPKANIGPAEAKPPAVRPGGQV